jgi:hypothetical protein
MTQHTIPEGGEKEIAIIQRIEKLEKDSHPPKDTVSYDTYVKEVDEIKNRLAGLERRFKSPIKNKYMNFGDAIATLKDGKKVARIGWNGKGMFLYYVPSSSYPAVTDIAKEVFGDTVPYGAYIAMKTAQNNVVPWLASQTDVLAEDWEVIN